MSTLRWRVGGSVFVVVGLMACGSSDDDAGLFGGTAGAAGAPRTIEGAGGEADAGAGGAGLTTSKGGSSGKGGSPSGKGGSSPGKGGSSSGSGGADPIGGAGGSEPVGGSGGSEPVGGSGGTGATGGTGGTGGSSTGGAGGSDPYAGSVVPKTCEQSHGVPGCCGPDGTTAYYFDGGVVKSEVCNPLFGPSVCGWDAAQGFYTCLAATAADPSGEYPLRCGGQPVPGACDIGTGGTGGTSGTGGTGGKGGAAGKGGSGGAGVIPTTCEEAHGFTGCCAPDGNAYASPGQGAEQITCSSGQKCGWSDASQRYDCGTSSAAEPTGKFPRACGGNAIYQECL